MPSFATRCIRLASRSSQEKVELTASLLSHLYQYHRLMLADCTSTLSSTVLIRWDGEVTRKGIALYQISFGIEQLRFWWRLWWFSESIAAVERALKSKWCVSSIFFFGLFQDLTYSEYLVNGSITQGLKQ